MRALGIHTICLGLLLSGLLPGSGAGQLTPSSAAMLGTANNYTALAKGFSAMSLNPAGLGMPSSPSFSLALFPVTGSQSLSPISLSNLPEFSGELIPEATTNAWLDEIASQGAERGGVGADLTFLAFNAGPVGFQASTLVRARAEMNEDAAELVLFGNAGRTGVAEDFDLEGSRMNSMAVSTFGVGFGVPLMVSEGPGPKEALAIGVTLKYSLGNALLLAEDAGSEIRGDPVEVAITFPMIQSDTADFDPNHGSGFGLDLGVAWNSGPWAMGAAVLNLFHTFQWDLDGMFYRSGEAFFDDDGSESNFDAEPGALAPQSIRDAVEEMRFKPQISFGLAYEASEDLSVTGDVRKRMGEGIQVGPEFHAGIGLEYRGIGFLPLRVGAAKITDGFQFGGGLSLGLGPVYLSGAGSLLKGDVDGGVASFSISFGGY